MKLNKKITATSVAVIAALSLTACNDTPQSGANDTEASQAATGENALLRDQPVPNKQYSQLRQNLIEIENAQADGAVSTSFFFHMGNPDPYLVCPSIGAPIASTTELTNPTQVIGSGGNSSSYAMATIDQMDPTGVYTGVSAGTWVQCVGANGKIIPQYAEPNVHAVFGTAHWDYTKHQIVLDGDSSFKMTLPKK